MKYKKPVAIIAIFILISAIILQLSLATDDKEAAQEEQTAKEFNEFGSGIEGQKEGDIYYVTSGTITGDLTGKNVVIRSGGEITISESMSGTLVLQGGTVNLPIGRAVSGTGTCTKDGCTVLSGESGRGAEKISTASAGETFVVKSDGSVNVLKTATIGEGKSSFKVTNVQNLKFIDGKVTGTAIEDSEIAGNMLDNTANFEYGAETKELKLTKPEDAAEDYKVKVSKFEKDAAIVGEHILFEDPKTPIKELIKGKATKKSDKHLVYGDDSKFNNEHNAVFAVTKETSYVADFKLPDDVEKNYIRSDVDEKAGIKVLSVFSRAENDVEVRVGEEPPYEMIDLDNFGSEVKITKENALAKENGDKTSITSGEIIVKSDKEGRLSANTIKNLKIIYRSMHISKDGARYDYVSSDGVGTCRYDCKRIITSISEAKVSRFTELVKNKEISIDDIAKQITSKNDEEKKDALTYIIETKDQRVVESLIELSKKETENPVIRGMAIRALGEIKDLRATKALIEIVENRDENLISDAIVALGNMNDPEAVNVLTRVIEDKNENPLIKQDAITALGKIEDPKAIAPLIKALKDKDPSTRVEALIALGGKKDPNTIEPIIKSIKDKDLNVRNQAMVILGKTENPEATKALVEIIENRAEDLSLRKTAVGILGRRGDPKAIEPLIKTIGDEDLEVEAMIALRRIKGPDSTLAIGQYSSKESIIDTNNLANNIDVLEKTHNEEPDPKDIHILSTLPVTDIEFDRKILEESLNDELKRHEHTMRSETGGYIGYKEDFDSWKDRLTSMELKKIELILDSMNIDETRNQIGELIQADLIKGDSTISGIKKDGAEGTFKIKSDKTEIGGLVFLDKDKKLVFTPYEPNKMRNNKAYDIPLKSSVFSSSFASFHLHAVKGDDSGHAGPSGGDIGDLASARVLNLDGIVITPVGENKFNIDYYTPDEKVIDIGNYEYKK